MAEHPILIVVYKDDARANGLRRAFGGCTVLPLFEYLRNGWRIPAELLRARAVLWTYVPQNEQLVRVLQRRAGPVPHWLYQHDEPHIRVLHPGYVRLLRLFRRVVGTSRLVEHTLPFIDAELFRPRRARRLCDVSLIVTTLYKGQNQWLPRRLFVEEMGRAGVSFHLYGPPTLYELPGYQRMLGYDELPGVIRGSVLNVSLHLGDAEGNRALGYVNERCMLVLGCGGLLVVDSCNDPRLRHLHNCVELRSLVAGGNAGERARAAVRAIVRLLGEVRTRAARFRRIRRRGRALAEQFDLAALANWLEI